MCDCSLVAGAPHASTQLAIIRQCKNCGAKCIQVAGANKQTRYAVNDKLGNPADSCCHHRKSTAHRFEDIVGKPLGM